MGLKERLEADQREAMRQGQSLRLDTIRLLRTALTKKLAAEKGGGADIQFTEAEVAALAQQAALSDQEIVDTVLARQVKQRRESIDAYRKAGRQDLLDREEAELQVLLGYLPEQLSEVEIEALAAATIAELGASGPRDMGKVMGKLSPQLRGKADMGAVSKIVQRLLAS
jgi:uncharacterized protein YqeY